MIHKLFIGFVIAVLCQSCIKQDEVEVEGSTLLEEKAIPLKVGESFTIDVGYREGTKQFKEKGEEGKEIKYDFVVDNPGVLSLSTSGVVKALKKGNASVKVSAFGSDTKTVLFNVVEYDTSLAQIDLSLNESFLVVGSKATISNSIKGLDGSTKSGVTIENWTSSNPDVASVNMKGEVTSLKAGMTKIQAQIGDVLSFPYNVLIVDTNIRRGLFYKIDYKTEGHGQLVLNKDNTLDLFFESDFLAENATGLPGVVVYLNNGDDANAAISSGLRIGSIPQNTGEFTMSVPIPAGETAVEVFAKYSHILLICEPFKISFGAAKLN